MIRIESQDGFHQYDEYGDPITTWDDKKCAWIVNSEYEDEDIDWWGRDNDFPRGMTLKEFEEQNPGWENLPDIEVRWTWENEKSYLRSFPKALCTPPYELPVFPKTYSRSWGHIDCPEEESIELFGKYCDFYRHADKTEVIYNGKTLFSGKLI